MKNRIVEEIVLARVRLDNLKSKFIFNGLNIDFSKILSYKHLDIEESEESIIFYLVNLHNNLSQFDSSIKSLTVGFEIFEILKGVLPEDILIKVYDDFYITENANNVLNGIYRLEDFMEELKK